MLNLPDGKELKSMRRAAPVLFNRFAWRPRRVRVACGVVVEDLRTASLAADGLQGSPGVPRLGIRARRVFEIN
jgi:hypothetical protein